MAVIGTKYFRNKAIVSVILLIIVVIIYHFYPFFSTNVKKSPPAVPVTVAVAIEKSVPVTLKAVGTVEAYNSVAVKALINGQITHVFLKEGKNVKKGSRLFKIDPRELTATLNQMKATLVKDEAALANAIAQEKRYADLLKKHYISEEQYAQIRTDRDSLRAVVEADKAAVENAKVQLHYTDIRSPIDGKTGRVLIQEGNIVKANDTIPLVIINQFKPIYVVMAIPERYLPELQHHYAKGPLTVVVEIPEHSKGISGTIAFIDNAVDMATGTVKIRALFPNHDEGLWPGQFLNATITLYNKEKAVVIPNKAIQQGPEGPYVFVEKADMTVENRGVVIDRVDNERAVIKEGIKPGEKVVTTGQLRLGPGMKVKEL